MSSDVLAALSLPLTWLSVGVVRRYVVRRSILDVPTHRSSHSVPTPRGGGIGVVLGMLVAGAPAVLLAGGAPPVVAVGVGAVLAVALVSWWDDRVSLPVGARLVVHTLAGVAVAALAVALGVPFGAPDGVPWIAAGALAWAFLTIASINVANFIDGIDGLLGAQFLVFGAYVAVAGWDVPPLRVFGLALAGSSLGFLGWNWAPARIFLGDVGSCSYGLLAMLGTLALVATARVPLDRAFLPLAPIFLDATVTLLRRARAGERLTVAHRSHLYQRLANGPWSHARTATAYAVAAAAGAAVALSPAAAWRPVPALAFLTALAAAGWHLERRLAPWRPAAR